MNETTTITTIPRADFDTTAHRLVAVIPMNGRVDHENTAFVYTNDDNLGRSNRRFYVYSDLPVVRVERTIRAAINLALRNLGWGPR